MASRQEEKEARRQARLEAEAAEAKVAGRRRRLQLVFGGVLGVLIIVGIVVGVLAATGGKDKDAPKQASSNGIKLPAAATTDLQTAVDDAGCSTAEHPIEGRQHEDKVFTESDYKTNPPTSGNHFPNWAQDGIYTAANLPQLGKLVHPLEHGRIEVQYKPGTPPATVDKLEAFLAETKGYHELLFPNDTNAPGALNATAWGFSLNCPSINDKTWDALRTFRDAHIDKGPETVA